MRQGQSNSKTRKRWIGQAWKLSGLPILLLIVLPLFALFSRSNPTMWWSSLQRAQAVQAIGLSFGTSLVTVLLTLLLGTPAAYYLSHRRYRFFRLFDTLVDLPTVLPPAVAGVALLMAFGRRGLVGSWLSEIGIDIPFTSTAVVLAQMFVAAPLYIKTAALGFDGVDCELRKAAALDGANRWQTFRHILLPLAWTSMATGLLMTWARAIGEFGATIIFAGNFPGRTQTMPLAIYLGFEVDLQVALTLSVTLVLVSFLALVLVKTLLRTDASGSEDEI